MLKKKRLFLGIVLGILVVSGVIGLIVVKKSNNSMDKETMKEEPLKQVAQQQIDPVLKLNIASLHGYLRYNLDVYNMIKLTDDESKRASFWTGLQNGGWPNAADPTDHGGYPIKPLSVQNQGLANELLKVQDNRIKTDVTRGIELMNYAVNNKDTQAWIYAYRIFKDLDVIINNATNTIDETEKRSFPPKFLFGVTELQGDKGENYQKMMEYINSKLK